MAFRNDRNFWLLSDDGKIQWGRYLPPWAPFQVAALPTLSGFGMGLAYSQVTDQRSSRLYPTIWLFEGEPQGEVSLEDVGRYAAQHAAISTDLLEAVALEDVAGEMGWLRYGSGDWRTGWLVSMIGDLMARNRTSVFTVRSSDGAWRLMANGIRRQYPLPAPRPYRMAAAWDRDLLALTYVAPDVTQMDEETRKALPAASPSILSIRNATNSEELWSAKPLWGSPPPNKLPQPALEFAELADEFNCMRPDAIIPFRVAASVAVTGGASAVAVTEYGGWLWVRRKPAIGSWDPPTHVIPFVPRQRGWLRIFEKSGGEAVQVALPKDGLFDVKINRQGDRAWCVPMAWFARGLAGCVWRPTDNDANTVFVYDLQRRSWLAAWQFPDAVNDLAVHPSGEKVLISCWDGWLYLVSREGGIRAKLEVGGPARLAWSQEGSSAVASTVMGQILGLDDQAKMRWRVTPPATGAEPLREPLKPVFEGLPVYSVGRVGPESVYVGDIWLIKTSQGGILVDAGGISSIPFTWERIRAAGLDPKEVRYVLQTHSHGDHCGATYLWRTMGAEIVGAETLAFTTGWLMPMLTDYGVWVPRPVDLPLPAKRAGDEGEVVLCGLRISTVFAPGHSVDSVYYTMELSGRRVAFTGDIGFPGAQTILHRCWGDVGKAKVVTQLIRSRLIPWRPEFVFTGHSSRSDGTAFLEGLVRATDEAILASEKH
jgi:glyoxylase-like metal-dependent hydrolase (beta-lactamase superfamily II)